jgi:uncharacterized protein (DUF58 family)
LRTDNVSTAVSSLDRVGVATFDSALRARIRALRGRGHLHSLLTFLEGLSPAAPDTIRAKEDLTVEDGQQAREADVDRNGDLDAVTSLGAVLRDYQRSNRRPGIVFVISDFLDPGDFRVEMRVLLRRGFDLNLIQVLEPEELQPRPTGDLTLVDSESGAAREITVNECVLAAYRSALAAYTTSLESFCRSSGIGYTMVTADTSFEDSLLKRLIEGRMAE